jgi:hypothetical protein
MSKNAYVSVGDKIKFNDHGGYCGGGDTPVIGKTYTIVELSRPYRTNGDCNATLCNGAIMRLSTVTGNRTYGGYTTYFEIVGGSNYEIY